MDTIKAMKIFGPAWVVAAAMAFSPIAVIHWVGIVALVATVLIVAVVMSSKVSETTISKRANVAGFGRLTFSLRSGPGKGKALLAVPAVAAVAAAMVFGPAAVKAIGVIAFVALLTLMLWPTIAKLAAVGQRELAKQQQQQQQQQQQPPQEPPAH